MFIILLLLYSSLFAQAQAPDLKFRHINSDYGLSNNNVRTIVQDHKGFMWFGTADGLNKYDGHTITVYKHLIDDSTSLTSSDITRLFEDSNKNLWVGTRYGLNRYNRKLDKFIRHWEVESGIITNIVENNEKRVWLTSGPHIYYFDEEKQQFVQADYTWLGFNIHRFYVDELDTFWATMPHANKIYQYSKKDQAYLPRIWDEELEIIVPEPVLTFENVIDVKVDRQGYLWFASHGTGIYRYNRKNGSYQLIRHEKNNRNSLWNDFVVCLEDDEDGRMWVGTQNGGISIYDFQDKKFYNFTSELGDANSLSSNSINVIYQDHDQNMWIGTFSGGVNLAITPKFRHFYSFVQKPNSLKSNIITSFCEVDHDRIFVGTDGGGLNIFDVQKGEFSAFPFMPDKGELKSNVVTYVTKDRSGKIWIGYWSGGIGVYDPELNTYKHFSKSPKLGSLGDNNVMYIYSDKQSDIWVATLTGLNLFVRESGKFIYYELGIGLENYVNSMVEGKDGKLWVGTWEGLKLLNKTTKAYQSFSYSPSDRRSLSNSKIFALHEDAKGRLWIGTAGGLNLLDKENNTFTSFLMKDGLPSDAIYGILEDDSGDLWLSTGNGISRFNPDMRDFKNYGISDGLQGREFKTHAYLKLSNGQMLFGGVNGFNMFEPNSIWKNIVPPPVVFTDLKIFNRSVKIGVPGSPLTQHVSETDRIILSHKESVFSIEFSALNFISPGNVQYEYMLEGFDLDWINIGNSRSVTYTNLNPGTYVFRVNASNHDGFWSMEGANLIITITPPFYKTWWFRIAAILVGIGIVLVWFNWRVRTIKQHRELLARQVEERTRELAIKSQRLMEANQEILIQGKKIQVLYNDMKDSIRAAKVIQQSVIESGKPLNDFFNDFFVYNQPKDVVGGDFLWFDEKDGKKVLAAVDCTGHGVSGAFMTIIGHQVLNKIILHDDWETAADILNKLNKSFTHSIIDTEEVQWNNGMDLAICVLDSKNDKLQFAGAKNPLYLVRNNDLIQIKGNNSSIGVAGYGKSSCFTNHEIDLCDGDMIYLFSDGYVDQFGGPKGNQKMMYPTFRKILLDNSSLPMCEQNIKLKEALRNWQGDIEQIDDILIVGVRIHKNISAHPYLPMMNKADFSLDSSL
jgi:ligand-binding sensor domain-containing protein/serine phosphatase RsbU (regulator of sigma subunit)